MEKLKMHSPDLTAQNIDRIAELFPTVVTETVDDDGNVSRAIDFDLLRQELSDHVVEGPQERYQLDWPGKRESLFFAYAPIAKTLRPTREESVEFDTTQNLFIEGDNLEVLKLLQESYLGKVKLIYIDPPYNTGNDFVYNDDFAESNAEYLAKSNQVDEEGNRLVANTESNGRFHSDWLSMMYSRLKLARNLLRNDGVIFISVDDNEHANLVEIAKEIFGAANYLGSVARVAKRTSNKGTHYAPSKDYVVSVARSVEFLPPFMDTVSDEYRSKFSATDQRGSYATVGLYQASLDPMRGCSNQRYWIECPDGSFVLPPGPNRPSPVGDGINFAPQSARDKVWRWSYMTYETKRDLLVFKRTKSSPLQNEDGEPSAWNIYTKYYLEDRVEDGIRPRDFLEGVTNDLGTRELKQLGMLGFFDFAKPTALVAKFLTWVDDSNAIVLDFFAGSSSTAHAVLKQNCLDGGNRKFIMVQLPESCDKTSEAYKAGHHTIADVSKARVRRAGEQILEGKVHENWNRDVGFRVLKTDNSNMTDVLRTPDQVEQAQMFEFTDSVKAGRTGEDLLFQVFLDWGLELTMPIEVEEIDRQEVFVVEGDALIACFAEAVSAEVVTAIAERQPLRAVFRDSGFATDADRINAQQIFAERSPATDIKTV